MWSPEHLFTAALSSCFMTTFLAIAEHSELEFISLSCPAEGVLDKKEGKLAMTEVILKPVLTIPKEADKLKAEKIMLKAEKACLISNSITAVVHLVPTVLMEQNQPA